jgi:hypothetical protein
VVGKTLLGSEGPVQELKVLSSREERIAVGHPNSGDDVILDEATKGLPRGRHQVLIVGISNEKSLGTRNLIL